jgi:hypothetical protein
MSGRASTVTGIVSLLMWAVAVVAGVTAVALDSSALMRVTTGSIALSIVLGILALILARRGRGRSLGSCLAEWGLYLIALGILLALLLLAGQRGLLVDWYSRWALGPIDWDSPRMLEIEREWQSLKEARRKPIAGEADNGIDRYLKYVHSVDRLFWTHLSDRNLCELAASPKLPPMPKDATFVYRVLEFMAKRLAESGDRQCLVDLLAKRCPSRMDGVEYIEFCVAFHGKTLKDPILVLGEAYAKSREPETRKALADSVRRGFAGFGIRGKDDAEYVNNAMRWYDNEKDHLIVNYLYPQNVISNGGVFTIEGYRHHPELYDTPPPGQEREPLFKPRDVPR